jgi:hypothetical protein
MADWYSFPEDLLREIFRLCDAATFLRYSETCRAANRFGSDGPIWTVYLNLLREYNNEKVNAEPSAEELASAPSKSFKASFASIYFVPQRENPPTPLIVFSSQIPF